jgi:hypothetical protein
MFKDMYVCVIMHVKQRFYIKKKKKYIYIYIYIYICMRVRYTRVEKTNSKITALINLQFISKNYEFRLSCLRHYLIPLNKIYKMNSSFDRWAADN